jgi:hypothetical protein
MAEIIQRESNGERSPASIFGTDRKCALEEDYKEWVAEHFCDAGTTMTQQQMTQQQKKDAGTMMTQL